MVTGSKNKENSTVCIRNSKGQIAFEAVIIIGFVFLLLIPLLYMLFSQSVDIQDEFRTLEVTRAMDTLTSTISTVGVIGPNGTAIVDITLPDNIQNISIGATSPQASSHEIFMTVGTSLGTVDIVRVMPYNVSGSISTTSGMHRIVITYYDGSSVINVSGS